MCETLIHLGYAVLGGVGAVAGGMLFLAMDWFRKRLVDKFTTGNWWGVNNIT